MQPHPADQARQLVLARVADEIRRFVDDQQFGVFVEDGSTFRVI
jgi:hypothetical protein